MLSRILFFLIILFFYTNLLQAQFRDFDWGTTKEMVLKSEGDPIEESEDGLIYDGEIADYDVFILYEFIDGGLQAGFYIFQKKHSNELQYISDFENVKSLLSKRYGAPDDKKSRLVLNYDTENNQYIDEGTKLSTGAIAFQSTWSLENLNILYKLAGNNYEISHGLVYKSKEYDKLKEEQNVSDF